MKRYFLEKSPKVIVEGTTIFSFSKIISANIFPFRSFVHHTKNDDTVSSSGSIFRLETYAAYLHCWDISNSTQRLRFRLQCTTCGITTFCAQSTVDLFTIAGIWWASPDASQFWTCESTVLVISSGRRTGYLYEECSVRCTDLFRALCTFLPLYTEYGGEEMHMWWLGVP